MKGRNNNNNISKQKRKRTPDGVDNPKKKRKLSGSKSVESAGGDQIQMQDPSELFTQDLASLNSDDKLPNSRIKEVYDSLRVRLLRLDGSAASQAAAAAAARAVLTAHEGRQLWRVLSTSATGGQAASALRLLSACVACGGAPARAVLTEFQFAHGRLPQVVSVKNLQADADVRTEFVTLVLAFLVGADRLLVQAIVEKVTPLLLVLSGLNTDRAATVHLVLSTFKQALLDNDKIAKKDKLRLFNARNLSPLLQLYNWRGHQLTWRSRTNRYKKKKRAGVADEEEEEGPNPADPEELLQVRENAHQFLTALCTSHKTGIVFRDASLGTSGANCNPVLLDVLKSLGRPWKDELKTDLVVCTLAACADLCRHYLPLLSEALCPPRPSAEWRAAVAMVTRAVAAVTLTPPVDERHLTPEAMCAAAAACHYPAPVSALIRDGIDHEDPGVRTDCLQLLVTVLDQVVALQGRLSACAEYGPLVRAALAEHVTPHVPPAERLAALWRARTADHTASDTALLARALVGCQLAAAPSWRLPAGALSELRERLPQLQLEDEERQLLSDQLQRLTDGTQMAVPLDRPLVPEDVPRILAEILAEEVSPHTAAGAGGTASSEHQHQEQEQELPTLTGESPTERLAAFVTMTTSLLRALTAEQSAPALRALVTQLTETLGDAGDSTSAESAETAGSEPATAAAPLHKRRPTPGKAAAALEGLARPAGWADWVKLVLKRSLRQPELGEALLPGVTLLCRRGLFPCAGGGHAPPEPGAECVSCELLYELLLSHSAFLERVLDPAESELPLRHHLLLLMLAVTERCQHVCRASHAALLLAAYGATMSDSDQTILLLLMRYELAGVSLQAFQPMVWGSAALNFYGPTQGGGHSLKSQPSSDDVIGLLDADKMAATCRRLPLKVTFKAERAPADASVYDVRFLAPLLLRVTAAEQPCEPLRLVSAGALGLALCLLSCRQPAPRRAGWTLLARLHHQLLASRHLRQRQVWVTLLELVRAAAAAAPEQRLPFVVVHAWCRLVLVLLQPTHRLFRHATRLLLRQAKAGRLEIARLPLFFELFNSSSSLEHRSEQAWIVGHLCQSVRQMSDYGVLQRTVTYKLLMALAASSLTASRPQLVKVLEVTARIPGALLDLHYRHGLLAWLVGLLRRFGREPATRAAIVALAAQMVQTVRAHGESGAPPPAALLTALRTLVARLSEATRRDGALSADVARLRRHVAQIQLLHAE